MADQDDDDNLKKLGCSVLAVEGDTRVVIAKTPKKDFDSLETKQKARFTAIMKSWCVGQKLMPNMFNYNEGRSKKNNVLLQAFKGFRHRFYGFQTTVGKMKTFIIVKADLDKKQDKADPIVLGRALEIADEIQSAVQVDAKGKEK